MINVAQEKSLHDKTDHTDRQWAEDETEPEVVPQEA